jgi:uncharacterized Zn finger protein (UPF0148 family)
MHMSYGRNRIPPKIVPAGARRVVEGACPKCMSPMLKEIDGTKVCSRCGHREFPTWFRFSTQ